MKNVEEPILGHEKVERDPTHLDPLKFPLDHLLLRLVILGFRYHTHDDMSPGFQSLVDAVLSDQDHVNLDKITAIPSQFGRALVFWHRG